MATKGKFNINYISYGITKTGGYRHEKFLYKETIKYFRKGRETVGNFYRKKKLFYNIVGYFELLIWGFFRSNGDINIVTARTGIPAMLRNRFSKNEVWIVLHNYDENDGKSGLLAWYYRQMFRMLKRSGHSRFKVICVAPYFLKMFRDRMGIHNTFLFPNLFDTAFYKTFATDKKEQWVHLGQFSAKNDPQIFTLAKRLSEVGYYCYFSTLNEQEARPDMDGFEVIWFSSFDDYLHHMARSCCTLALTRINEGWPRLAHESLLVGTPVIGYANGGLSDLLKESDSIVVKDIDEAFTCIREALWVLPGRAFLEKYDSLNVEKYLKDLCSNL